MIRELRCYLADVLCYWAFRLDPDRFVVKAKVQPPPRRHP
jgi:hypothetical protein